MGRSTEIYMFDKHKSSNYLYSVLTSQKPAKTFNEFIQQRKEAFGESYNTTFEETISTVKENINLISPDSLDKIILYLNENQDLLNNNEVSNTDETLIKLGIIPLYKIHTSTACYSYMFQFGNFEDFFPFTNSYENGYNLQSSDFLLFNDYMILLMHKIITNKLDDNDIKLTSLEVNTIEKITEQYKGNQTMQNAISKELHWLSHCIKEENENYKVEKNTIYTAPQFLYQSLEMRKKIQLQKDSRIVIIDAI
ncbi:hypothetical protein [Tenacibaculum sp. M341]|uniref:hypothetical protein n=1 Tax=Tenacibaculum sp. M341 TaxID=2530339 RepID=UPI001048A18B|nr:hypothetical protein [Tenacibaculum sp. M341]TCI90624.1 hypothetical protein EYW44_12940 [Tenacibaculum sp. M341]